MVRNRKVGSSILLESTIEKDLKPQWFQVFFRFVGAGCAIEKNDK